MKYTFQIIYSQSFELKNLTIVVLTGQSDLSSGKGYLLNVFNLFASTFPVFGSPNACTMLKILLIRITTVNHRISNLAHHRHQTESINFLLQNFLIYHLVPNVTLHVICNLRAQSTLPRLLFKLSAALVNSFRKKSS